MTGEIIFHGATRVLLTKTTFLYRVIETVFKFLQFRVTFHFNQSEECDHG